MKKISIIVGIILIIILGIGLIIYMVKNNNICVKNEVDEKHYITHPNGEVYTSNGTVIENFP